MDKVDVTRAKESGTTRPMSCHGALLLETLHHIHPGARNRTTSSQREALAACGC